MNTISVYDQLEAALDKKVFEQIHYIVFGEMVNVWNIEPEGPLVPEDKINEVMFFERAKKYLWWNAFLQYGEPGIWYPFYAWSERRVFFISEYDTATNLSWVPRDTRPDTRKEPPGVDGYELCLMDLDDGNKESYRNLKPSGNAPDGN